MALYARHYSPHCCEKTGIRGVELIDKNILIRLASKVPKRRVQSIRWPLNARITKRTHFEITKRTHFDLDLR